MNRRIPVLLAATIAVGCGRDAATSPSGLATAGLWVVNATRAPLDVSVDGVSYAKGLGVANVLRVATRQGTHAVHLAGTGEHTSDLAVSVDTGAAVTTIVRAGDEGQLIPGTLPDTGAAPVDGRTKLRVVHLAEGAPDINVWRIQPDYSTAVRVMFPFPYGAQSSYIQSTPGAWTVWVTPTANDSTMLASSGPILMTGGQVGTVVLLDSAGVLRLRAIVEH